MDEGIYERRREGEEKEKEKERRRGHKKNGRTRGDEDTRRTGIEGKGSGKP